MIQRKAHKLNPSLGPALAKIASLALATLLATVILPRVDTSFAEKTLALADFFGVLFINALKMIVPLVACR